MVTIRLLANVANDPKGAVLQVTEDAARRLVRTGYAEPVTDDPPRGKRKGRDESWPSKD